jgi:hypothetical protein
MSHWAIPGIRTEYHSGLVEECASDNDSRSAPALSRELGASPARTERARREPSFRPTRTRSPWRDHPAAPRAEYRVRSTPSGRRLEQGRARARKCSGDLYRPESATTPCQTYQERRSVIAIGGLECQWLTIEQGGARQGEMVFDHPGASRPTQAARRRMRSVR